MMQRVTNPIYDDINDIRLQSFRALLWTIGLGLLIITLIQFTFSRRDPFLIWTLVYLTVSSGVALVLLNWISGRVVISLYLVSLILAFADLYYVFSLPPHALVGLFLIQMLAIWLGGIEVTRWVTACLMGLVILLNLAPSGVVLDLPFTLTMLMLLGGFYAMQWLVFRQYVRWVEWALDSQERQMQLANSFFSQSRELKHLNDRLNGLNTQLEEARKIASDASNAKSTFLSNTSHELRTPLNTIIGYSSSMLHMPQMYQHTPLPEVFRTDVANILTNGQYLVSLINDILDLSKIEAGKLELIFEGVELTEMFRGVIATSVGLLRDKPITIRPDYPESIPMVWGDSTRIRQILLNLMSNAIKYTDSGSVTLWAEVQGNTVHIGVTDTGIGIPNEKLSTIFDRFEQVQKSHQTKGTGLGLDISQQLAKMHGSLLMIESTVGLGSTFSFILPIATAEQIQSSQSDDSQPTPYTVLGVFDATPMIRNILLVMGDSESRITLRELLEAEDHVVFDADLTDALDVATAILPDLIVIDMVQGMQTLVESLKSDPDTYTIPIAVLGQRQEWAQSLYQLPVTDNLKQVVSQIKNLILRRTLSA
ncbi:MAG: ATP-binding protein [Phototrophicaceae bacterium]